MTASIMYGGKRYITRDALVFQPISEFNTAIRQGAPSNDDRNLASFFSFEDARAGIGTIFGQVREDPDKIADNDGLITMKMNQLILPPRAYERPWGPPGDPETGPELDDGYAGGVFYEDPQTDVAPTRQLVFAWNHNIWRAGANDAEYTYWTMNENDVYADTSRITQMLRYVSPVNGGSKLYFAGVVNADGTAETVRYADDSAFGSQPTAITGVEAEMLFIYNGKLWAGGNNVLRWSIDPTDPDAWEPTLPAGGWPKSWKFIGVFPFGDFAFLPYVISDYRGDAHISVIDLDTYTITPLALGLPGIIAAFPHQGKICIIHNDGNDVTLLDTKNMTQMPLDWNARSRDGFVDQRRGIVRAGASHPDGVVVAASVLNEDGEPVSQLFMHRGTGWHPYGRVSESPRTPLALVYSTAEVLSGVVGSGNDYSPQTFTEDGVYTVPAEVTKVTVDIRGGQGGADGISGRAGGKGSRIVADIDVTPGEDLNITVGTAGGSGASGAGAAGTPGGGAGAAGGGKGSGGGGGYSAIERDSDSTVLLIAGGGGGSSRTATGGYGGTLTAGAGGSQDGGGGGGGTSSAGGAAGTADGDGGSAGEAGSSLQGGAGGAANSTEEGSSAGGGGGGGYYGGGGGGGAKGGELPGPQTFNSNGTYTVPAGVTQIHAEVRGAAGGAGRNGLAGGRGAIVKTTINVTPGEQLTVIRGTMGASAQAGGTGGSPGGGNGGDGGSGLSGGGGGGYSAIRRGSQDLVIAAGGGGSTRTAKGGYGGAAIGAAGQTVHAGGGSPATIANGGAGGAAYNNGASSAEAGTAGSSLQGGNGGNTNTSASNSDGGGGGGGGLAGGGGGGGAADFSGSGTQRSGGGGGGGTSLYSGPNPTIEVNQPEAQGNGLVIITPLGEGSTKSGGGGGGGSNFRHATDVGSTVHYGNWNSGDGLAIITPVPPDDETIQFSYSQERFYMLMGDDSGQQDECGMYDIRWFAEPFQPGRDQGYEMEGGPLGVVTPWFDMGFNELDGTLLLMSHGGYADEKNTVTVQYQLDFDSSAWEDLGSFPHEEPAEPEITGRLNSVENERTLLFDGLQGVKFRWVRFRFLLETTEARQTPNGYPLTLRFVKRPNLRESIRIAIDVKKTLAERPDLENLDDLWIELKQLYDEDLVPKLEAGPYTTWAQMISLPRVLNVQSPTDDDVTRSTMSEELDIVINVAELV